MHLEHVARHLQRREREQELKYSLGLPASEAAIQETQSRLGVLFPPQIKQFYRHYNGLAIDDPPLEVLSIVRLVFLHPSHLHFATVDRRHHLCFHTSNTNEAGQWDIVVAATGYKVTLTMASFWSNKMWAWIDKRRTIWRPEPGDYDCTPDV